MTLHDVLSIQTHSGEEWRMFAFIIRELKRQGVHYTTDESGNIYAQKGTADNYPCIVAHMDSVHPLVGGYELIQRGDYITAFDSHTMRQTGIGGDDKCGVYIALRCMAELPACKVAFFVDEERGCVGSGQAEMSFFNDCRYVLQADRRGNSDFITTASGVKLSSKKFQKALRPILPIYGYKPTTGMMTDVMALKQNGLNVSCANFSCGYHRPHSADECVCISEVERCLDLFLTICTQLTEVYGHNYEAPVYSYAGVDSWSKGWKNYTPKAEMYATSKVVDSHAGYCDNCMSYQKQVTWSRYWYAYLCDSCEASYKF